MRRLYLSNQILSDRINYSNIQTLSKSHLGTNRYQIQPNSMTFTQRTKTSADAVDDDVLDRAVLFLDNLLDRANLDLIHDHCYNLDGVEDDWK